MYVFIYIINLYFQTQKSDNFRKFCNYSSTLIEDYLK